MKKEDLSEKQYNNFVRCTAGFMIGMEDISRMSMFTDFPMIGEAIKQAQEINSGLMATHITTISELFDKDKDTLTVYYDDVKNLIKDFILKQNPEEELNTHHLLKDYDNLVEGLIKTTSKHTPEDEKTE